MLDPAHLTRAAVLAALLLGGCERPSDPVGRGRRVIDRSVCGSCHVIPGIALADGMTGPSLSGLGSRVTIGGVLPNTPSNLSRWIRDPQRFAPGTAMPPTGLTPAEAYDAAVYLEHLRKSP